MKPGKDFWLDAIVLLLYLSAVLFGIHHHELWGDEIHSWNIVKGSHSLNELLLNIRYEGHPPVWYLYLFCFAQFSHSLFWLQSAQFLFVIATAIVLLLFAPFSRLQKILLLCGNYFVFEYSVLARNYMPAVLIACCIAAIFYRDFKYKTVVYYFLLLLLSNVHLLGLLLALSIHAGYCFEKIKKRRNILKHVVAGMLVVLPSIYFILPPADSQLNFEFWIHQWSASKFYAFITVVVKSFFPFPDVGNPHWWNTHFFLDNDTTLFRGLAMILFVAVAALLFFVSRKSKTAFVILFVNLLLTFLLSLIFPLNASRYVGFTWIGFVVAAWISLHDRQHPFNKNIFVLLLLLQLPAGFFCLAKDAHEKFSAGCEVIAMQKKIPPQLPVATDYWCLNILSAWLDTPVYCIELNRSVSYLIWNSEMKDIGHYDYAAGLEAFLKQNNDKPFYFYSVYDRQKLLVSALLQGKVKMTLVDFSSGSVEKSGNVYLYLVERQ